MSDSDSAKDPAMAAMWREIEGLRENDKKRENTLYGEDGRGGLCRDMSKMQDQFKFIGWVYVLATAVALPLLNEIMKRLGFPLYRSGG